MSLISSDIKFYLTGAAEGGDVVISDVWVTYTDAPYYLPVATDYPFFIVPNSDNTEMLAIYHSATGLELNCYLWTELSGVWTYKGSLPPYLNKSYQIVNPGKFLNRPTYWDGYWWFGATTPAADFPYYSLLVYSDDLASFNTYELTPSSSYPRLYYLDDIGNSMIMVGKPSLNRWCIYSNSTIPPVVTTLYTSPTSRVYKNARLVWNESGTSYRLVVFSTSVDGLTYYISISSADNLSTFLEYTFSTGKFPNTLTNYAGFIPVHYIEDDRFYFAAKLTVDGDKTYLFSCTFTGTISTVIKLSDSTNGICSIFSWRGYLWISATDFTYGVSSSIGGYIDSNLDDITWVQNPIFEYTVAGKGQMIHDNDYVRLIGADITDEGANKDVRLEVTQTEIINPVTNSDIMLSLGGYSSTTLLVNAAIHNLFDVVSTSERVSGDIEYRCFVMKNTNWTYTFKNIKIWILADTRYDKDDVSFAIEIPTGDPILGICQSVATEGTSPIVNSGNVSDWSDAVTEQDGLTLNINSHGYDLGPNEIIYIWVRRNIILGANTRNNQHVIFRMKGSI